MLIPGLGITCEYKSLLGPSLDLIIFSGILCDLIVIKNKNIVVLYLHMWAWQLHWLWLKGFLVVVLVWCYLGILQCTWPGKQQITTPLDQIIWINTKGITWFLYNDHHSLYWIRQLSKCLGVWLLILVSTLGFVGVKFEHENKCQTIQRDHLVHDHMIIEKTIFISSKIVPFTDWVLSSWMSDYFI